MNKYIYYRYFAKSLPVFKGALLKDSQIKRYNNSKQVEKSRIRETKNLSTDADSSTDTKVGRSKNTKKPNFFFLRKKIIQNAKTQKRLEICQYKRYTLRPEVSNPSGSVVSTIFF